MNATEIAALCLDVTRDQGPAPAHIEIGDINITTNHGHYVLKDAVWEQGDQGVQPHEGYFPSLNGTITGYVVSGGDTSRLFTATSFTSYAGTRKKFYYCYLPKIRPSDVSRGDAAVPCLSLEFCG